MFKNALVSCSNKAGLAEFLKPLQKKGLRIVSTGGTARYLKENGLAVVDVSSQTKFPEVMDGRVKTLHPLIHMALLARENNSADLSLLKDYGIEPFDLVIGNLYPFEEEPSVETIDIGGPSFLRAAAKNFERITVLCQPDDYAWVSEKQTLSLTDRQLLAAKVFAHTSSYDAMISHHYAGDAQIGFRDISTGGEFVQALRYGENPQQKAAWFRLKGVKNGLHSAQMLQGKELSYNNLLDLEAAISTVREFRGAACVAVKHNSPCGVAANLKPLECVVKTLEADPQSVFGGIIAVNFTVTENMAEHLSKVFLECIVARDFDDGAKKIFSSKKNLRLLVWPQFNLVEETLTVRTVSGGFLLQQRDQVANEWQSQWTTFGETPSDETKADLLMAWQVCAHLKSNAICLVSGGQTVGLGMGQVNRVDAVSQALERAKKFHPHTKNIVLASDAFFPFADSIELIAQAGIRFIIQPGGSMRDDEVKAKAREMGVTMVMTGTRHFLH